MKLCLLLLALLLVGCSEEPYGISVTFPETGGLKPGDNVTLHGLSIGQVSDVDIEAEGVVLRVEVKPRFAKHLTEGAIFSVESEKMVTGKKMLVITAAHPPGPPLKRGAKVAGARIDPDPVARLKTALSDSIDRAEGKVRDQVYSLPKTLLEPDHLPPRTTGGTVDLDAPGEFTAQIVSLRVRETTADGEDWDGPGGGDPDLIAQVWVGERQVLLTPVAEDTKEARWDLESEPFALDGRTPLRVKVIDRDMARNDEVGIVEMRPTPADGAAERVFRLAGGRIAEIKIRLKPRVGPPKKSLWPLPPLLTTADAGAAP